MIRLFVTVLLVVSGCSADTDAKLGAQGETCFVDDDCQIQFLCDDGVCDDGSGNNSPNNAGNNGPGNNDSRLSCGSACDYFSQCVDEDPDECRSDCEDDTADWTPAERRDTFRCILELSCDELLDGASIECIGLGGETDGDGSGPGNTPTPAPSPDPGG